MEPNEGRHKNRNGLSYLWGAAASIAFHALLVLFVSLSSLTYLYPPPEEKLLIEFEEMEVKQPERPKIGTTPKVKEPDPEEEVKIVKSAEAQEEGSKRNEAQESTMGDEGDVPKYEPPRKKINHEALSASADNAANKDTLSPQRALEVSDKLSTGHAAGNSKIGVESDTPNAHLEGRSTRGNVPKPEYDRQVEGIVVVKIWVDQRGNVTKAEPNGPGTTVTDRHLWNVARKAAMETHFNESGRAPAFQEGTITYIFKLQ